MSNIKLKSAVVIGAGIGGLAIANILAKAGLKVTVYEKNAEPGGRMGKLKKDGFTFDTGPSWYLMKDVFEDYFNLFDKKISNYYQLNKLDPGYKVFYEASDPILISGNFKKNLSTFESIENGSAKRLCDYIINGEKNYRVAMDAFLYNPFKSISSVLTKSTVLSVPSFLSVFTKNLHNYVSKNFKDQRLQQILEYPSVFLGVSPFSTPALYQLMSYLDFKEGIFYPKNGGMYKVTESFCALGKELGVKYKYNQSVSKIVTKDSIASGIIVNDRLICADLVISNADLNFTETKLLSVSDRSYDQKYWSKRSAGPSALLMYLGVKGVLPELEHHNLFFIKDWRKNFDQIYKDKVWPEAASMYVSKTTATDKSTAPSGFENIFVLVPLPAGISKKSTKQIDGYVDSYLSQIEQQSGVKNLRERIVFKEIRTPEYFAEAFNSWQNTALGLSHTLRQSAFLRPSVKSKKVKNLYYVGAGSQPGIGVPMCIISSQLVYKNIIGDNSASRPTMIDRIDL